MRGTFVGKIYPERSQFNAGGIITSQGEISGKKFTARIDIQSSVISVSVEDDFAEENLGTFRNTMQAQLRKFANYAALHSGSYHFVLLEGFIDAESGKLTTLANREILDEKDDLTGGHSMQLDFKAIDTPAVARALEAYNNALREHDYTAKYALEAIEGVREHWGEEKWIEMREALNLKKETLTRHNEAANAQKHGKILAQTWEQRRDQLLIARECIPPNRLHRDGCQAKSCRSPILLSLVASPALAPSVVLDG